VASWLIHPINADITLPREDAFVYGKASDAGVVSIMEGIVRNVARADVVPDLLLPQARARPKSCTPGATEGPVLR